MSSLRPDQVILVQSPQLLALKHFLERTGARFGDRFASGDGVKRRGGSFCLMHHSGMPLLLLPVGFPNQEKVGGYTYKAYNKCKAMLDQRYDDPYLVSSWSVRDHDAEPPIYGGGIRLSNGDYMSFSGFPELVDEAYMIYVGQSFNLLDEERIMDIVQVSGNSMMLEVGEWLAEAA